MKDGYYEGTKVLAENRWLKTPQTRREFKGEFPDRKQNKELVINGCHLYSTFFQCAAQLMLLIHPFTHTHTHTHTVTAIGCHARYQPARQEQSGVRGLAQGHFDMPRVGTGQRSNCQTTALTSWAISSPSYGPEQSTNGIFSIGTPKSYEGLRIWWLAAQFRPSLKPCVQVIASFGLKRSWSHTHTHTHSHTYTHTHKTLT